MVRTAIDEDAWAMKGLELIFVTGYSVHNCEQQNERT